MITVPLSESERKVLERLELQFQPPPASRATSGRWRPSAAAQLALAVVGVLAGLALEVAGVALDDAAGIVLACAAYLLTVAGAAVVAVRTAGVRAALAQRRRTAGRRPEQGR